MLAPRMRARMHGLGFGLLLVVATAAPAIAQPSGGAAKTEYPVCSKEVSKSDSDAAHAKYLSGKVDYDEGKYASAIANFKAAYERDCTKHELLVIISRAHELDHNSAEAIRALEVYLERQPNSPEASVHRAKIATLKERLAEERKKAAATPPPTATTQPGSPPPSSAEGQGHTIYPWLVVGAGVVSLAVGVVLIATTPALPAGCFTETKECNLLAGETRDSASYKERRDEAGRHVNQPVIGAVVTGVGGALVVGGLVWHFLEPTGPKESAKTKVQPQLGPGYGGFALTGRF